MRFKKLLALATAGLLLICFSFFIPIQTKSGIEPDAEGICAGKISADGAAEYKRDKNYHILKGQFLAFEKATNDQSVASSCNQSLMFTAKLYL